MAPVAGEKEDATRTTSREEQHKVPVEDREDFEKAMQAQHTSGWVKATDLEKSPETKQVAPLELNLVFQQTTPQRTEETSSVGSVEAFDETSVEATRARLLLLKASLQAAMVESLTSSGTGL